MVVHAVSLVTDSPQRVGHLGARIVLMAQNPAIEDGYNDGRKRGNADRWALKYSPDIDVKDKQRPYYRNGYPSDYIPCLLPPGPLTLSRFFCHFPLLPNFLSVS